IRNCERPVYGFVSQPARGERHSAKRMTTTPLATHPRMTFLQQRILRSSFDRLGMLWYITAPQRNFLQAGSSAGCRMLACVPDQPHQRHHTPRCSRMSSTAIERIGIDESGKGDYFGPLVIAAVFVDATTQDELALMAVRDSKKISDGRIL